MEKTLDDYREILAGWEQDLEADERRYTNLLADLGSAYECVVIARAHVAKLKAQIDEMERLVSA